MAPPDPSAAQPLTDPEGYVKRFSEFLVKSPVFGKSKELRELQVLKHPTHTHHAPSPTITPTTHRRPMLDFNYCLVLTSNTPLQQQIDDCMAYALYIQSTDPYTVQNDGSPSEDTTKGRAFVSHKVSCMVGLGDATPIPTRTPSPTPILNFGSPGIPLWAA